MAELKSYFDACVKELCGGLGRKLFSHVRFKQKDADKEKKKKLTQPSLSIP